MENRIAFAEDEQQWESYVANTIKPVNVPANKRHKDLKYYPFNIKNCLGKSLCLHEV